MKKDKNSLRFSQQLEAFQAARRAKEVNEIYKFDQMKEQLKQRHLTINRRMDTLHQKSLRQKIEDPQIPEEQTIQEQAQMLQELVEFDRRAYDMQVDAADNKFDTIADIQGFHYQFPEGPHYELKQLPEAHADVFDHELNELTERELQKELEQNEKTLQDSLKKTGRLELPVESSPKQTATQPAPLEQRKELEADQHAQSVSEAEAEEQKTPGQESVPEEKKSGSGLIYFRSNPPHSAKE